MLAVRNFNWGRLPSKYSQALACGRLLEQALAIMTEILNTSKEVACSILQLENIYIYGMTLDNWFWEIAD